MKMYELASRRSQGRGIAYYQANKVRSWNAIENHRYAGIVSGSDEVTYDVIIDEQHPRRSTCTCPYAEESNVICKHMVALYFAVHPEDYLDQMKEMEELHAEIQRKKQERYLELKNYVLNLSKKELQEQLLWKILEEDDEYKAYEEYENSYYSL